MKISGIGIVAKEKVIAILTSEGREAVKSGDISLEELGEMYKYELTRKSKTIMKACFSVCQCDSLYALLRQ